MKKLTTGPAVTAGVGFSEAGFPVPVLTVAQSLARASRLLVQSVKYMRRKTSTRNQIRDVTITTRSVSAVRRFIAQVSAIQVTSVTLLLKPDHTTGKLYMQFT